MLCFRRVSGVWFETMVGVVVGLVRGVARARHFVQWGWGELSWNASMDACTTSQPDLQLLEIIAGVKTGIAVKSA